MKMNEKELAAEKQRQLAAMADGSMDNQKIWQYIKERTKADPERLDAPAIMDCSRTYTYAEMFEEWDKYARVFSALNITGKNKSRAAIVGTISAEPTFAYYGLNMTGTTVSMFSYPDLLPGGRWRTMVEKEHITDMIVSDIMVTKEMWDELKKAKEELGLQNIILLHSRMGGPSLGYAEMLFNEYNYHALKHIPDVVFMDDLIEKYKDEPIQYAKKTGDQIAVICHTSGTSNGTRKPLPYTDRMVNRLASDAPSGMPTGVASGMQAKGFGAPAGAPPFAAGSGAPAGAPPFAAGAGAPSGKPPVSFGRFTLIPAFDFSSSSNINGFINMSFASGNSIATTFFGFMHPKYMRAFKHYNIGVSFTSGFMVDQWMELSHVDDDAFSSLKVMGFGGSYISPTKFDKYEAFLRDHGFKGILFSGYGMSELAGSMFMLPRDSDEDTIGYPDDVNNYRILDEETGKFQRLDENPKDGILYGKSKSMCLNKLDGVTLYELTEIDGENFVCMNDVIHVNENGTLSYAGRSNQFFANSQGVKFESGLVEMQLSAHKNIKLCAIVPVLDKRIHDTVPIVYAVPEHKDKDAAEEVRQALVDVFVKGEKLRDSILPTQFVIVDSIPFSASGKIDVYNITRSRLEGVAYNIVPVKKNNKLVDVQYEKAEQLNSYIAGNLPEGMGTDSAFGVFDVFSKTPQIFKFNQMVKDEFEKYGSLKDMFKPPMLLAAPFTMPLMMQFTMARMTPFIMQQMKEMKWKKPELDFLPNGIPVQLLQVLLHMESTPEGLEKFQKLLDMIFAGWE